PPQTPPLFPYTTLFRSTPKSMAPPGARGGGPGRGGAIGEQTPLMLAARSDHEEVMRALVAAGADPSLKAQDGTSLLMTAAAGARDRKSTRLNSSHLVIS